MSEGPIDFSSFHRVGEPRVFDSKGFLAVVVCRHCREAEYFDLNRTMVATTWGHPCKKAGWQEIEIRLQKEATQKKGAKKLSRAKSAQRRGGGR